MSILWLVGKSGWLLRFVAVVLKGRVLAVEIRQANGNNYRFLPSLSTLLTLGVGTHWAAGEEGSRRHTRYNWSVNRAFVCAGRQDNVNNVSSLARD